MKAVFYHADSHFEWGPQVGDVYHRLYKQFEENCAAFGLTPIHLTLEGFPSFGCETHYYDGLDPKNVMANREVVFHRFLRDAPDEVYWFTEPDYRIFKMWPPLEADIALLYRRGDRVPLTPSWRMATKKALPIFEETAKEVFETKQRLDWHCDSEAFNRLWMRMRGPKECGLLKYKGIEVELRNYFEYVKGKSTIYGRNYLSKNKLKLLDGNR